MKYYQNITLLPDAETNLGFLWHKIFQQIHIGLVDNKLADGNSAIAVCFPDYGDKKFPLGNKLRLFSETEEQLKQFDTHKWLSRLLDYCHIKSIELMPITTKFVCFKRMNAISNLKKAESLARHLNKPVSEILQYRKENGLENECELPYIHMESQTKIQTDIKNKFRLFITLESNDSAILGEFDCYGLSKTATVPWF